MLVAPFIFRIVSHHGSILTEEAGGKLANENNAIANVVLACRPSLSSNACLLLTSKVIAAHLTMAGSKLALCSPLNGRFLTFAPPDPHSGKGNVDFAARVPRIYEQITLAPADTFNVLKVPQDVIALVAAVCQPDPSPVAIAALFAASPPRPHLAGVLNALSSLMTTRQLSELADHLFNLGSEGARNLSTTFADDLSAAYALPQLVEWLNGRCASGDNGEQRQIWRKLWRRPKPNLPTASQSFRAIGKEMDRLDTEGMVKQFVSLPFDCNILLRRLVKPRLRACIVATARNEGLYLLEWIAHHRAVGFEKLFIYSNDNNDGSDDLLQLLAMSGEILWIKSEVGKNVRAQWKAYSHALRVMPDILDYEWSLFIDIDEFFVPNPAIFRSVTEFLDIHSAREVDAIAINWIMFGSGGQIRWSDDTVARRFPNPSESVNRHVKTMFRPREFIHSYPHNPWSHRDRPFTYLNACGEVHRYSAKTGPAISENPNAEFATINHYFFKSNEEYLWKFSRNRGDHFLNDSVSLPSLTEHFIKSHVEANTQPVKLNGIGAFSKEVDRKLLALKAIPGMHDVMQKIKSIYAERIPIIISEALVHPEIIAAGPSGEAFMSGLIK